MSEQLRITANLDGIELTVEPVGEVTAAMVSRRIGGQIVRYDVLGRTSYGQLRVRPGALSFPSDLSEVVLTREHDRASSRGHLVELEHVPDGVRASFQVASGSEGDEALREAKDKIRAGLSYDAVDVQIVGDEIVSGRVIAVGQVSIPAYDGLRIDRIAASAHNKENSMTPEQIARLAALRAQSTRTAEEETELTELAALETPAATPEPAPAAPAPAAPAAPAPMAQAQPGPAQVPAGVQVAASASTTPRPTGLAEFRNLVTQLLSPGGRGNVEVTAALADVTHAQHTANVERESWTGQLWSGLAYENQFLDLFATGPLESFDGKGWRFVVKPEIGDYAGNKADIPTNVPTTEESVYQAFRLAGGWDIDRKFFDFPNAAFIAAFLEAARENYAMKMDFKVRDYMIAQAVTPAGVVSQSEILKAAALAAKHVKRNTRAKATFIYINDDDLDQLWDVTQQNLPAFLDLVGIDPKNFRSSPDLPAGQVYAGVKQAATVRQLPGASPLRVEVQNLSKGGIDDAIFGYGAIEEHHPTGIVKIPFAAV